MHIIKLNAIDSTNSYLKKLAVKNTVKSFTTVIANEQTLGRGQVGTQWVSEVGKNLTFSMLIKFDGFKIEHQFYLSMAVSLAILNVVKSSVNVPVFVKWPNDILAEKGKVAGILIENMLSGNFIRQSVIGIGLNVNQENFPKTIGKANSLKNITGLHFDKDELLQEIIQAVKLFVGYVERKEFKKLKTLYLAQLHKFMVPAMFEDKNNTVFMGKIVDVFEDGKLVVELENEKTHKFNLKEIKFVGN